MGSLYSEKELKVLGLRRFGKNVLISRKIKERSKKLLVYEKYIPEKNEL